MFCANVSVRNTAKTQARTVAASMSDLLAPMIMRQVLVVFRSRRRSNTARIDLGSIVGVEVGDDQRVVGWSRPLM